MTSLPNFDRYSIQWLYIRDLVAHPKVQRGYREWWAKQIAEEFDPDLFKPLDCVLARGGKTYWVFEGQHRLGAARIALGEDQKVPCHVYDDVPLEQQAKIARGTRRTLAWQFIEDWAVRAIARDEVVLKIDAVLARYGLKIAPGVVEGHVHAASALEQVWHRHGGEGTVDRVVGILTRAWGKDRHAFDSTLVRGLGLLLQRLGDQIDDEELALRMAKHAGPAAMVGQARDYAKINSMSVSRGAAEKMWRVYTKGRRGQAGTSLDLPA